jgi:hypothetical protein
MLEKTEGAIENGQSRDTGNIGYTRHRTKTNKTQKHNTGNLKDEQHEPHQKTQHRKLKR